MGWGYVICLNLIGFLSLIVVEDGLTHSHRLGCHLDKLILLDVLKALFQRHHGLRNDAGLVVGTRGTDVGELLGLADVDDEVVVVHVLADDLPHIDILARVDEELAAILQLVDSVCEGMARIHRYHGTIDAALNLAFIGLVLLEAVGHDGFTL